MKRTRLNRKTPMPRGNQQGWNSTLRPISERKRKEMEVTKEQRAIMPGVKCELCNRRLAQETHEITAGAHRHRGVLDPRVQAKVCRSCHELLQGQPYAWQIASLMLARIMGVNACHGSNAVDVLAVLEAAKEILTHEG